MSPIHYGFNWYRKRGCLRKAAYSKRAAAEAAAAKVMMAHKIDLFVYQCEFCRDWHLTKKRQEATL